MSYGLKYTFTFRDEVLSNTLYKVNIYKNGWVGGSTAVKAAANPLSLSYKKQDLISPICGSELTIGLMAVTNNQFAEFLIAAPLQYYVDVLKSTNNGVTWNTYWSGVNTTDCYTEPWKNAPYPINLKFNCGLGELQWHRYENATSLITGLEQIVAIISNCLSFLPYTKNIREIMSIREDSMSDSSGLLEQLYLMDVAFDEVGDDGILHGIPCNKLLNQILTSLNCRIYQSNNMWYVQRIYDLTKNSVTYFDYQPTGIIENPPYTYTHIATGSYDPRLDIANSSQPKLVDGGDLATTQKKPSLAYQFMGGQIDNVELLVNSYFEDTPTSKNKYGQPFNWDFGTNLAAYPMTLQPVNTFTTDAKRSHAMVFDTTTINDFTTYGNTFTSFLEELSNNGKAALSGWEAHAVRRTGDVNSNPNVYIDTTSGSLVIDLEYWINIRITPDPSYSMHSGIGPSDVSTLMYSNNEIGLVLPIEIMVSNNTDNWTFGTPVLTNAGSGDWHKSSPYVGYIAIDFHYLNNNFPNPCPPVTTQAIPLTSFTMAQAIQDAHDVSGGGGVVDLYYNYVFKNTIPFKNPPFTDGTGIYNFDVKIYPPYYKAATFSTFTIELANVGANVIDFQYKDSYQATTGYVNFYSSPDNANRWNEQKVSAIYGDTVTPGYPGSFRLISSAPTSTWHNLGETDKGQILSDILFQNYSGLIANYRKALTGKIVKNGGIGFWQNIQDEDGTIYAQVGSKFDFKKATLTVDMEEVSSVPVLMTKGNVGTGKLNGPPVIRNITNEIATAPALTTPATPISKKSLVSPSNILSYPTE